MEQIEPIVILVTTSLHHRDKIQPSLFSPLPLSPPCCIEIYLISTDKEIMLC